MSERNNVMHQMKPVSHRTLLMNLDESNIRSFEEKASLQKYKETFRLLEEAQSRLVEIIGEINKLTPSKGSNYDEKVKALKEEKYKANNAFNRYEQLLHNLEQTEIIKSLIDEARRRHNLQMQAAGEAALAAWKEADRLKRQQLANSYQRQRNENLQEQAVQRCQHEAQAKQSEQTKKKAQRVKPIATVISILLCIALYLLILTVAFTNERDTFICYTTKTGECFHSATCQYISKSAYETTVYEACRDYRPCSHCNPCVERYETTITERNYIIPFFISTPISIVIFLLLTYRKKED